MTLALYAILIIFIAFTGFIFKKYKQKNVNIEKSILVCLPLLILNLPVVKSDMLITTYNALVSVFMSISIYMNVSDKKEVLTINKDIIKNLIPIAIIMLTGFAFSIKLILSIVVYLALTESKKRDELIAYITLALLSLHYFLTNYYQSPLSEVNYIISEIKNFLMLGTGLLISLKLITELKRWFDDSRAPLFSFYWSVVFIYTSTQIMSMLLIKNFYIYSLVALMITTVLIGNKSRELSFAYCGIILANFINPFLLLIFIPLQILSKLKNRIDKSDLNSLSKVLRLIGITIIAFIFKDSENTLAIISGALFILILINKAEGIINE